MGTDIAGLEGEAENCGATVLEAVCELAGIGETVTVETDIAGLNGTVGLTAAKKEDGIGETSMVEMAISGVEGGATHLVHIVEIEVYVIVDTKFEIWMTVVEPKVSIAVTGRIVVVL